MTKTQRCTGQWAKKHLTGRAVVVFWKGQRPEHMRTIGIVLDAPDDAEHLVLACEQRTIAIHLGRIRAVEYLP